METRNELGCYADNADEKWWRWVQCSSGDVGKNKTRQTQSTSGYIMEAEPSWKIGCVIWEKGIGVKDNSQVGPEKRERWGPIYWDWKDKWEAHLEEENSFVYIWAAHWTCKSRCLVRGQKLTSLRFMREDLAGCIHLGVVKICWYLKNWTRDSQSPNK